MIEITIKLDETHQNYLNYQMLSIHNGVVPETSYETLSFDIHFNIRLPGGTVLIGIFMVLMYSNHLT